METTDTDQFEALAKLEKAFGCSVYQWPAIPPTKPGLLQFRIRAREARIVEALKKCGFGPITRTMRYEFWRNVRIGQDVYEDAGGYMWRCWKAALGLPYQRPQDPYSGIIRHAMKVASSF